MKNDFNILLQAIDNIIGKKVKVISKDKMDDNCNIADHLRWHIGDEFTVHKIEIHPYGVFLYKNSEQNLNIKRAKLIT